MLQAFRSRGLTNVVYGVLIVGMVLVFVLGFNPSAGKKHAEIGENCAARVRGHCVAPKDHLAAYRILIPRGEGGDLRTGKAKQMGLFRIALEGLVERELLVNDAERLGISVTEDEVTDAIYDGLVHVSIPADRASLAPYLYFGIRNGVASVNFRDQKSKHFDMKVYERAIKGLMGRSPTEFREEQARELQAAKMRDVVRTPVRVSEAEALSAYIDERSTATLSSVVVRPPYLAKYLPAPTQKEIDAWASDPASKAMIDQAADEAKEPRLRHILVKVSEGATDADKQAAKAKVASAIERVKKGASFAAVAKEISEDGSAGQGGNLGTSTEGFVAPFKEAADKLKPGEMTDAPVETQFGFHAIMRDKPMSDDERLHVAAGEMYTRVQADKAARAMADQIQADLKAGKDVQKTIDAALAALATKAPAKAAAGKGKAPAEPAATGDDRPDTDPSRPQIVATAPFNRGGEPISGLSPDDNVKVVRFAFEAKDKDGMDEVLRSDQGYVLVSLKEHKVATKEEFAKDKDVYMEMLVRQKQDEAFALYVARLKDTYKAEISMDEGYIAARMGNGKKTDGGAPAPQPTGEDEDE